MRTQVIFQFNSEKFSDDILFYLLVVVIITIMCVYLTVCVKKTKLSKCEVLKKKKIAHNLEPKRMATI